MNVPPPQSPQPSFQYYAQPPKKKSKGWIWLVGICGLCLLGSILPKPKASDAPKGVDLGAQTKEKPLAATDDATVDQVVYKVIGHKRVSTIKGEFTSKKADGVFIIVELAAHNTDKETHNSTTSLMDLVDDQGRKFSPSSEGMTAASMAGMRVDMITKELQPGVTSTTMLIYDVPTNSKSFTLRIRPGMLSADSDAILKVH